MRGPPRPRPKPKTLIEVFTELEKKLIKEDEMFPVLLSDKERRENEIINNFPKEISSSFVKQFEKQILKNHCQQGLEELSKRGGLHPTELCSAMYGVDIGVYFGKRPMSHAQTVFAINMITMKLNDFKKEENHRAIRPDLEIT